MIEQGGACANDPSKSKVGVEFASKADIEVDFQIDGEVFRKKAENPLWQQKIWVSQPLVFSAFDHGDILWYV